MANGRIKLSPAELKSVADKIEKEFQTLSTSLYNLEALTGKIENAWNDPANVEFLEKYNKRKREISDVLYDDQYGLDKLPAFLRKIADRNSANSANLKNKAGSGL